MDKTLKAEVEKVVFLMLLKDIPPDNRKSNSLRPLQIRWKKSKVWLWKPAPEPVRLLHTLFPALSMEEKC